MTLRPLLPTPLLLSLAILLAPAPFSSPPAVAQDLSATPLIKIDREVGAVKSLTLEVGQNRLLILSDGVIRVSVADPRVADLKVITPNQLLLTAKGVGTTDLTMWNKKDEPLVVATQVTRNLEALRKQLRELFPQENITVSAAGELVVLSGEASDVRVPERAAEVAQLHADKIANLLRVRGNQQVQLEVKFAEVSRKGLREMSFNLFHRDPLGRYVAGIAGANTPADGFIPVPGTGRAAVPNLFGPNQGNAFSVFFSGLPSFPFSAMVSLLESTGLAKMLAEPTLVAMSGQEARFLAGGEFPIPYSTGFGQVSISWKKFGIILAFTPTVIDESSIHLKLAAEVSDVDPARAVNIGGYVVPGLTSRQSETTVRLGDGQSFAIAGLLSNRVRSQLDKIPLFGDIPILGALFRSADYRRDESELLVVVTARLAKPMAPHEVPALPTDDELNDPNDIELFLLGSEGRAPARASSPSPSSSSSSPPPADGAAAGPAEPGDTRRAQAGGRGPSGELGFIR